MAMTADSSSPDGLNSPQFRRKSGWAQVVRGESESISTVNQWPSSPSTQPSPPVALLTEQSAFLDCSNSKADSSSYPPPDNPLAAGSDSNSTNNAAVRSKKPAWNKPSNGVVEGSPVMGAASWPALSESARTSPKSLADSTSKTLPDGSLSSSQGLVIPQSTHKQGTSNSNHNSTPNRTMSGRQRSSKRGGSGGAGSNSSASDPPQSGFSHQHAPPPPPPPPPPPTFPVSQLPSNSYSNFIPPMPDPSMREPQYRGNNWENKPDGGFASQSHSDHRQPFRRGGNNGPRGDGSYHNNYGGGGSRDPGNAREHQRAPPRGFPRHPPPPPGAHAFVPPQPVRPFVNPIGYPEFIYFPTMPLEPFRGMPLFAPAPSPAMILPVPELPLPALLLHQIDYYFSDANLVKDEFLKSNMDDQGWVPISLIAGFPRVKSLTSNIQLILDSLRSSTVVEVQDEKLRRLNEWIKWIPSRVSTESGMLSPGTSSTDVLASSFQQIRLKESANQSKASMNPNSEESSGKLPSRQIGHPQLANGDGSEDAYQDQN